MPRPPENFQRILSGEVSGKELMKMNQKAAEDYNNEVLEPCSNCGRTFLPEALVRHKNCCKEDKPMSKKKGPSYTSKAKSRVNYPKLKTNKNAGSQQDNSSEETASLLSPPPPLPQSPSLIRKETITISKQAPASDKVEAEGCVPSSSPPAPASSIQRKDTVVLSRASPDSKEKERTVETKDVNSVAREKIKLPTKDEFIQLIETEPIFESQQHRAAILGLVTGYARNVRKSQILELLDNEAVFEDVNNLEEVITLLTEYVKDK